jgi:hypothetical protein
MRHLLVKLVCGAVLGALGVACTMHGTNQLPEDLAGGAADKPPAQQPGPQQSATPTDAGPVDAQSAPVVTPAKDAGPAAPTSATVTNFTLINADDDQPIANYDPIPEAATITLAALPSQNLNIRANLVTPNGETIGSVAFDLDGVTNFHIEGAAPYALGGDTAGDFPPLTPALAAGAHTLTGTTYSDVNATGNAWGVKTLTFTLQ